MSVSERVSVSAVEQDANTTRLLLGANKPIVVASLVTLILRRLYAARKRDAPQAPDSATEGEDRGTGGD
jgi:hypothetical protein